jgi:hypothetical protein
LPKHYIVQQLGLAELSAVADGFQDLASLIRARLDSSMSPLKSTENKLLGVKKVLMNECLAKLRRYMTLLGSHVVETNEGILSVTVQAEFKLIHQNINNVDPAHTFSLLMLESSEEHCEGTVQQAIVAKMWIGEEWFPFWTLKGSSSDTCGSQFLVEIGESGIDEKILQVLHQNGSPPNFTENIFLLALAVLMVDLFQKSQGVQLIGTPFEEVMALLIDRTIGLGKYGSLDFDLPDATPRKRNNDDMDTDMAEYQNPPKRFMNS